MNTFDFTDSVRDAQNGSEEAFQFLYEKTADKFRSKINQYVSNEQSIEDVLQNAYIKIYQNLNTLKEPNAFLAWGKKICEREAIGFLRKNNKFKENEMVLEIDEEDDEDKNTIFEASKYDRDINPEVNIDAQATKDILFELLDNLTPLQRNCLLLWAEDIPEKEIAEQLGSTYGSVRGNIHYAMKKMKPKLVEMEKKLGVAIFAVEPVPFFLWILRNYDAKCTAPVSSKVAQSTYQQITQGIHAVSTGSTIASATSDIISSGTGAEAKGSTISNANTKAIHTASEASQSASANATNTSTKAESDLSNASSVSNATGTGQAAKETTKKVTQGTAEKASHAGTGKTVASATGKSVITTITSKVSIKIIIAVVATCLVIGGGASMILSRQSDDSTTVEATTTEVTETTTEATTEAVDNRSAAEIATDLGYAPLEKTTYETSYTRGIYHYCPYIVSKHFSDTCLAAKLFDFDQDGDNELLIIDSIGMLNTGDNADETDEEYKTHSTNSFTFTIYEYEEGNWTLSSHNTIGAPSQSEGNTCMELFINKQGQIFLETYVPYEVWGHTVSWRLQGLYYYLIGDSGTIKQLETTDDLIHATLMSFSDDDNIITFDDGKKHYTSDSETTKAFNDYINTLNTDYGFNVSLIGYKSIPEQDSSLTKIVEIKYEPEESVDELIDLRDNSSETNFGHINVTITPY